MFRFCAAIAVFLGLWLGMESDHAKAHLIIAPAGTVLYDGNNFGDDVTQIGGLNLKFFGQAVSNVWVAENGNLNFSSDGSFFPMPLGTTMTARIAPLWDDFLLLQNQSNTIDNRVLLDLQSGHYLAVTWQNVRLYLETEAGGNFPNTTRSAQVVWFESDSLIDGIQYKAGDIAFGYVPHVLGTGDFGEHLNAVVGLDSGAGTIVPLPGTNQGQVTAANTHLLGAQNEVVLFRATAGGGYTASLVTVAVPEPNSLVLAAYAAILFCFRRNARGSSKFATRFFGVRYFASHQSR